MTQTRTSAGEPVTREPSRPEPSRPEPSRAEPSGSIKLTGRGAVVALFAACLSGLLIAAWTGWTALADAVFVLSCGVVACYTRAKGLRNVMVCPPLAFLAGTVCAQLITAPGSFLAAEGTMITLGTSAPWLFTGTALTIAIAIGRGYRPQLPGSWSAPPMIAAVRDTLRARLGGRDRQRLARPAWGELAPV